MSRRLLLACLFLGSCASPSIRHVDRGIDSLTRQLLLGSVPPEATIAILPFRDAQGRSTELGRLIADGVTDSIVKAKKFSPVDRNHLCAALDEMNLGLGGLTDQKAALSLGKVHVARYLLVGTLEPVGKSDLVIQARLLETETGRLAASARTGIAYTRDLQEMQDRGIGADPCRSEKPAPARQPDESAFIPTPAVSHVRPVLASGEFTLETLPFRGMSDQPEASMAAGKGGTLHIVATSPGPGGSRILALHTRRKGVWDKARVIDRSSFVDETGIAVGEDGAVHVVYSESDGHSIRYARIAGGKVEGPVKIFRFQAVGRAGCYVAVASDAKGNPHVAIATYGDGSVYYTGRDGAAWSQPVRIDRGLDRSGTHVGAAVDRSGSVLIAYMVPRDTGNGGALKLAERRPDGTWIKAELQPHGTRSSHPSVLVERSGAVRLGWFSYADGRYYTMRREAGRWSSPVGLLNTRVGRISLALDSRDRLHVSGLMHDSEDNRDRAMGYASEESQGFREVLAAGEAGSWVFRETLAVDSDGIPHLVWANRDEATYVLASLKKGSTSGSRKQAAAAK